MSETIHGKFMLCVKCVYMFVRVAVFQFLVHCGVSV